MPRSLRRVQRRVEATVQRSARSTFPTHNKTRHVNNNIINVMGSSSADRRTHGHRDRGTQREGETARHYGRTETGTERLRGFCCLVLFCSFCFCLVLFGSFVCPFQKGFKRRFVIVSMCVRVCVQCMCVYNPRGLGACNVCFSCFLCHCLAEFFLCFLLCRTTRQLV